MNEELKQKLIKLAQREHGADKEDFSACDYSGGNYDDAFSIGVSYGEICMARDILKDLGIKY